MYELDLKFYINFHPDLKTVLHNYNEANQHYYTQGKNEDRIICEKQFQDLYPQFNVDIYGELHIDFKQYHFNK
jgi:hypothetical protein